MSWLFSQELVAPPINKLEDLVEANLTRSITVHLLEDLLEYLMITLKAEGAGHRLLKLDDVHLGLCPIVVVKQANEIRAAPTA